MSGFSKLKKNLKRSAALLLTALMAATCVDASVLSVSAASSSVLSNDERGVIYANSRTDFRDESIYFVITTRFYDGDPSNNARTSEDKKANNPENDPSWRGDFAGLIDKLDYIKALGFTAIWITPVVENDSGYDYHGYHAYDFSAVDKRYESNGITYQTLIDACHDKGIKVIQDIVLNHTCNWGEKNLLQLTSDVYSERNQAVMNGSNDPENIYHHNGFCGGGDWDNYEAQRKTIADDCFDLETENPKVYNYLVDCYTNYINMGVDGFRIDTVKHIPRLTFNSVFLPAFRKAGGENFYMFGEVCTKGHDVWYRGNPPISTSFYTWADDASWTGRWSDSLASNEALVDEHYLAHMDTSSQPTSTNAFLNGNDYHTPDYSSRSGMDAIDFQMHWSFNNANEAFNTALGEDQYFNDSTWNVVYVDSHDYAPDQNQTLRYTGGTDAWAENLSLMFTFRGIPCLFYGSEIEFQAGKPIDVGPNAPLSETGRAYFGDNIEGNVDTADFTVFGNVSGTVADTLNSTLSQHIMRLNRIRQSVPALRKGQYSTEGCSGNIAFKRRYTDSNTDSFACVAISGSATFTGVPNGTYIDAVTGDTQTVSGGTLTANVSGKGNMKVYVLNTSKTSAPGRVIPNGDYLTDGGGAEKIGPVDINVKKIDPTGITLDNSSITITEGSSQKVTATVSPSNATNKTVTWSTNNAAVATVSGGTITGVAKGTATITAETSNGLKATVSVTVKEDLNKPTGVTVSPASLTIAAGGSDNLTATVSPSNATNKTVTWTSSDTSVATVSGGTVTAVSEGSAVITATTSNGLTATSVVTVTGKTYPTISSGIYFEKPASWGNNVNAYFFDKSSNTTVGTAWPGTAMKLDAATGVYTLEYSTTNSNLAIVFNDGSNQAPGQNGGGFDYKDHGLYTSSGFSKVIEEVKIVDVTSVSLDKTSLSLNAGDTASVTATVAPSNATNKTITWTSSNTSVATVSGGVIKAVGAGTATITASSNNGKTASVSVTVAKENPIEELLNNSKISSTSITLGNSVTVTAAASGGTGSYTYEVTYKKNTDTNWATKQAYSTNKTVSIKPGAATTYTIKVRVKDGSGTVVGKNFTVKVTALQLTNNSTIDKTAINLGESVKITAAASGGTGSYTYEVTYKKNTDSSWATKQAYSTNKTVSIKPGAATTYTVKARVKDSSGTVVGKNFTVKVTKALTNSSKISASSVTLGGKVTITTAATGGTGYYNYAVLVKKSSDSSWTTKQNYSSNDIVAFKPGAATTYVIRVKVKDTEGTIASKDFTLKVTRPALANNSTIDKTSINLGDKVTVTAAASGGAGSYTYEVTYKKSADTDWATKQAYSTNKTVSIKPGAATKYTVKARVKDSSGTVVGKNFTVNVTSPLANNSTIDKTSIDYGDKVTVTAAASGGSGSYTYEVTYKKTTDSDWATKQAYSTNKTVSIKPGAATKYTVKVRVKDSSGTVVGKNFTVNVTSPLTNNATISAVKTKAGSSLTVKCAASGGTSPYTYKIDYMKVGSSSWTSVNAYKSITSAKVTFASAGTYSVRVIVKDASSATSTQYFTVTVS